MGILDNIFNRGKQEGDRPMSTSINTNTPIEFPLTGEQRPWGAFVNLARGGKWHIKILEVSADKRLSMQHHEKREEFMILLDGDARLHAEHDSIEMSPQTMYHIPIGAMHRVSSVNGARVLEVSRGEFDEGDIVRHEDDY